LNVYANMNCRTHASDSHHRPPKVDLITITNRTRRSPARVEPSKARCSPASGETNRRQNSVARVEDNRTRRSPFHEDFSRTRHGHGLVDRIRRSPVRVESDRILRGPAHIEATEEIRLQDFEVPPTPVTKSSTTTMLPPPAPAPTSATLLTNSEKDRTLSSSLSPLVNNTREVVAPPSTAFCVNIACIEHPDKPRWLIMSSKT